MVISISQNFMELDWSGRYHVEESDAWRVATKIIDISEISVVGNPISFERAIYRSLASMIEHARVDMIQTKERSTCISRSGELWHATVRLFQNSKLSVFKIECPVEKRYGICKHYMFSMKWVCYSVLIVFLNMRELPILGHSYADKCVLTVLDWINWCGVWRPDVIYQRLRCELAGHCVNLRNYEVKWTIWQIK